MTRQPACPPNCLRSHPRPSPGCRVRSLLSLTHLLPEERRLHIHHLHVLSRGRVSVPMDQQFPAPVSGSLRPGNPIRRCLCQSVRNLIASKALVRVRVYRRGGCGDAARFARLSALLHQCHIRRGPGALLDQTSRSHAVPVT